MNENTSPEVPAQTPETAPAAEAAPGPQPWWKKDWAFVAGTILVTLAIAWGMARVELVSRAKHAYLEGERYYSWMSHPDQKKAYFDAKLAAGKITQDQYTLLMQDSDLKNAFVWYQTVIELFQPPRSQWVVKSEARMKEIKPKYIAWLKSLGIHYVE